MLQSPMRESLLALALNGYRWCVARPGCFNTGKGTLVTIVQQVGQFLWTILLLCVISGFCHRVNEIIIFGGYDVALISSSLLMFQDNLSVPSAWVK